MPSIIKKEKNNTKKTVMQHAEYTVTLPKIILRQKYTDNSREHLTPKAVLAFLVKIFTF